MAVRIVLLALANEAPGQQQEPTLDLDSVVPIPMAPVELLGNQLNTLLEGCGGGCARGRGTASGVEQMVRTRRSISQNGKI